ncbi:MAG: hypothetical protein ACRDRD_17155 [Pseudonocardiaceae bacterium]
MIALPGPTVIGVPKPPPKKRRRRRPVDDSRAQAKAQLVEHRRVSRLAVIARARGRCELPRAIGGCPDAGQAWHHAVGRGGKGIREPHASSPALTIWLCNHHHGQAHALTVVREAVRMAAAGRLGIIVDLATTTPLRAIREALASVATASICSVPFPVEEPFARRRIA